MAKSADTTPPTLDQIKADIIKLGTDIETYYRDSPALRRVKQVLTEAVTGIEQELRNLIVDAQLAKNQAEKERKESLFGRK